DPTAKRLRERVCFRALIVSDSDAVDASQEPHAERVIADAIAADQQAGSDLMAVVSMEGRTFGDGDSIVAEAISLPTVSDFLPWYTTVDTLQEASWPAALGLAEVGASTLRV